MESVSRLTPAVLALVLAHIASAADSPLLHNGTFEAARAKSASLPAAWRPFSHDGGDYTVARDGSTAADGKWSIKIHGRKPGGRAGVIQSGPKLAKPALGYGVELSFKGVKAVPDFFLRYRMENAGPEAARTFRFRLPYRGEGWQRFSVRVRTPRACANKECRLEMALYGRGVCEAWYDHIVISPLDKWVPEAIESARRDKLVMPLKPKPGATVAQNPPDLAWPPVSGAASYVVEFSQDEKLPRGETTRIERLPLNLYNHYEALAPGRWHWRYGAMDEDGAVASWSRTMAFVVPPDAAIMPLPKIEELRARVPRHPRIFAPADKLDEFRAQIISARGKGWASFLASLERHKKRKLLDEPADVGHKQEKEANRQTYPMCNAARDLAFGYLITGDRAYAHEAKRFILHLCSWDPNAGTSYRQADQSFRKITMDLAYCWDCMGETFTEQEKAKVLDTIRVRGEYLYRMFTRRPIHGRPYDSHGITVFGYFVHITLAVVGDVPEAEDWFRYIVPAYWNIIPPWGGDDGGWCQGTAYWRYSNGGALEASRALRTVLGLDITRKPWFQNNGNFALYCVPPFLPRLHFGDGNRYRPGYGAKIKVARYAKEQQNRYYQWYAFTEPSRWSYGRLGTMCGVDWDLAAKPPVDLPQAKHFRDIGWVAMHERMWDPQEVMFFFKSSDFGSFNHSHADQNHFVLNAFGEALAIDSGYYYRYGCPHDRGVARQTKYHNAILVDGRGQGIFNINASGRIARFLHGQHFDYTVGDGAAAYMGHLPRFDRHVLFLRPNAFVIFDDLRAAQAAEFTWCLHALEAMRVDAEQQRVDIDRRGAHLMVRFVEPAGLAMKQDDVFDVPTIDAEKYPNQWHLYATTPERAEKGAFLTALVPYRTADAPPRVQALSVPGRHGLMMTWADGSTDAVAFAERQAAASRFELGRARATARSAALRRDGGGAARAAFIVDGTSMADAHGPIIAAASPCTASWGLSPTGMHLSVDLAQAGDVAARCPYSPKELLVDGEPYQGAPRYDAARKVLTVRLPGGPHRVFAGPREPLAELPAGTVVAKVGERVETLALEAIRRRDHGILLTGALSLTAGPYRVDLSENAGYDVSFTSPTGGLSGDGILWVSPGTQVAASADVPAGPCTIRMVGTVCEGIIEAPATDDRAAAAAGAVLHESHDLAEQRPVLARPYTHRTFLHGSSGLSNWQTPGHYIRWEIPVPKAGEYLLVLKASTHEKGTRRTVKVNGRSPLPPRRAIHFPFTGGYGARPEEWRHYAIPNAKGEPARFRLPQGKAVVEMRCLQGLLNLDYLLLAPAGD